MHRQHFSHWSLRHVRVGRILASPVAIGILAMLLALQPVLAQTDSTGATVIASANSTFGDILTDASGMALYMFDTDSQGVSNCYGGCAQRWPPLLIDEGATPVAGEGVTAELSTTTRDDGTIQVTADGWPLYYWYQDAAAGDTDGQGVGDVWWLMAPDGAIIRTTGAAEGQGESADQAGTDAQTGSTDQMGAGSQTDGSEQVDSERVDEDASGAAATQPADGAVASREHPEFGALLTDSNGMTLYMFDQDISGTSTCYDACAERWPPLLAAGDAAPSVGEGVTAELGTTERTDGTYQVTANGQPLYYWYEDAAPGDARGQAVGEVWWVLAPNGISIRTTVIDPDGTPEVGTTVDANLEPDDDAVSTADVTQDADAADASAAGETGATESTGAAGAGTGDVTEDMAATEDAAEASAAGETGAVENADQQSTGAPSGDATGAGSPEGTGSTGAEAAGGATAQVGAPDRLPVTGGGSNLFPLAVVALSLLIGSGWVVLLRSRG